MLKPITTTVLAAIAVLAINYGASAQTSLTTKANGFQPRPVRAAVESDRINDGLVGPVSRVRTEIVKLSNEAGRVTEGKRAVIEVVAYDIRGRKTENQYFPIAGATLNGKEVYKYDDKGNISEMSMFNDDGSLLSKEIYKYEFDFGGNWNRMTTSTVGVEGGKIILEPSEVTYRSIMYYLDKNTRKLIQPAVGASQTNTARATAEATKPLVPAPPKSKRTAATRKARLPTSSITAEKLNAMDSPEVKKVSTNADPQAPVVVLDSEPPTSLSPTLALSPVSGGVLNGTALNLPSPLYPDNARRMRISGIVSVDVVLDETGKVIFAQATRGPVPLRDAAVQAALRARFSPTMLSGRPVRVSGVINYNFALSQ
jgi:periplasmic protein TonB